MEKKKQTEGTVFISEADQYLFAQGTHYDIYKKLGAHPSVENGRKGTFFGVWAPNAASVHVIGTFNGWNEEAAPWCGWNLDGFSSGCRNRGAV